QQVEQEEIHIFGGALDALEVVMAFRIQARLRMLTKKLGKTPDRAQGSAQIVRNRITETFEFLVDFGQVLDSPLQFLIQRFYLAGLFMELYKNRHLGTKDLRNDWSQHVVHGAKRVALEDVVLAIAD